MLETVKMSLRRSAKWALGAVENTYRIDPRGSRQVQWHGEEREAWHEGTHANHRPDVAHRDERHDALEIGVEGAAGSVAWRTGERLASEGVCEIERAVIWVMHPSSRRRRYAQERKAIVFNRYYRPVASAGLPHLWVFLTSYDWRRCLTQKRHVTALAGRIAVLGNFGFDTKNYYHFWADAMADLWFLRRQLPESRMPERYLIHFAGLPWQWEILEMCGIERAQVIPMLDHEFLKAETALLPVRDKGAESLPSWLADAIRRVAGWQWPRPSSSRRLYISRADALRRRVTNEQAVCERLREAGFQIHTLNGLSVAQQQALFASASVVCAPHGAALTNLVWCRPGTLVVDFLPSSYLVPCFQELSRQSGVDYRPVICSASSSEGRSFEHDITIPMQDITAICHHLTAEGETRVSSQ